MYPVPASPLLNELLCAPVLLSPQPQIMLTVWEESLTPKMKPGAPIAKILHHLVWMVSLGFFNSGRHSFVLLKAVKCPVFAGLHSLVWPDSMPLLWLCSFAFTHFCQCVQRRKPEENYMKCSNVYNCGWEHYMLLKANFPIKYSQN